MVKCQAIRQSWNSRGYQFTSYFHLNMKKIKLLLVDDHSIFLDGLKMLISAKETLTVVDAVTSADDALNVLREKDIDVVITDINMPEKNGLYLIKQALSEDFQAKFIALTMIDDAGTVVQALEAGADGYLLKNTSLKEVMNAIEVVSKGDSFVSPAINSMMVSYLRKQNKSFPELTKRERQVLKLVVQGLTSKEIADALILSVDTIKFHRKNVHSKLNLSNTIALVNYCQSNPNILED
ncbi:MAG: response regulator [Cryomorphaceae bacterium]|nr:response regulator [Cryomorphaceae bacterium]